MVDLDWKAKIVNLRSSNGMLARNGSYAEVWKVPGEADATVMSQGNDTEPYEPFFCS